MNEDELKRARDAGGEQVKRLEEEFPNLGKEMEDVATILYALGSQYPLRELIYRTLMTGATLVAAKHWAAEEGSEDLLSKLTKK